MVRAGKEKKGCRTGHVSTGTLNMNDEGNRPYVTRTTRILRQEDQQVKITVGEGLRGPLRGRIIQEGTVPNERS